MVNNKNVYYKLFENHYMGSIEERRKLQCCPKCGSNIVNLYPRNNVWWLYCHVCKNEQVDKRNIRKGVNDA